MILFGLILYGFGIMVSVGSLEQGAQDILAPGWDALVSFVGALVGFLLIYLGTIILVLWMGGVVS